MNPWALTLLITCALFALGMIVACAAHLVGEVLDRRGRALLVAVSFAAGFCTAVGGFYLRT